MKIDWQNRNCYNYGRFEHLVRNYRNRGIEGRRLEYRGNRNDKKMRIIEGGNEQSNLNRDKNLIVLN